MLYYDIIYMCNENKNEKLGAKEIKSKFYICFLQPNLMHLLFFKKKKKGFFAPAIFDISIFFGFASPALLNHILVFW